MKRQLNCGCQIKAPMISENHARTLNVTETLFECIIRSALLNSLDVDVTSC